MIKAHLWHFRKRREKENNVGNYQQKKGGLKKITTAMKLFGITESQGAIPSNKTCPSFCPFFFLSSSNVNVHAHHVPHPPHPEKPVHSTSQSRTHPHTLANTLAHPCSRHHYHLSLYCSPQQCRTQLLAHRYHRGSANPQPHRRSPASCTLAG